MARLGLTRYDKDAPLQEELVNVSKVKFSLKPAYWCTGTGNRKCRRYGNRRSDDRTACKGLSVGIHATISGKVTEVTDRHVVIARN